MDYFKATPEQKAAVITWRDAAIADGWNAAPTYGNETMDRAVTMERDGFKAMILTREPEPDGFENAHYSINVWCPRGLALAPSMPYSFERLQRNTQLCSECGKIKESVERVAFANRVCSECAPKARAKYETKRWCD